MGWGNILVPRPLPGPLLESVRKFRPTFVPLVPTMYVGMLSHPDIDRSNLKSAKGYFSGSDSLPVEVIKNFEKKTGAIIVEGYGLTETSPVTHINPFHPEKRKIGSIGVPVSDTECRIADLDDGETDVPVGESGEMLIRGPQVMKGYLNMPEETDETLTSDGWLHTGDIARMDEDGYFYIVERKKDLIISGGYNVYPRDIEEVFYEHPDVKEACAIGIPHPRRGETVKVFVITKQGKIVSEMELMEFCKKNLAKYKWPLEIEFRDELPKTNIGKIMRKDLRAEEMAKKKLRLGT